MTKVLHNTGIMTNTKRVGKLMHLMGLLCQGKPL
nr:hypothetical protein [Lactococcus cremoris]